ncbi:MAG: IS701 family transposase [Deltaproteobacteria bacterium]|nr:IS701 family transposase [Deltaproteobacteria bacterium]
MANLKLIFSQKPMEGHLGDFPGSVDLHRVDETKLEPFWNDMVKKHHYLGYDSVIGSRVKYLITLGDRIVGAISFCSAAYQHGLRDRYIGWDEPTRLSMLPSLVNNNRFLILPWVKIRNLASRVLSLSLKRLKVDWLSQYGVEPIMAETFVDHERYTGTSYIAANWVFLGTTRGFGRQGKSFVFHGHQKGLYVKIMSRRFNSAFQPSLERLKSGRKELLAMITEKPVHWNATLEDLRDMDLTQEIMEKTLADHLETYKPYLTRVELDKHFVAMIKGMLSDLERKSIEPICLTYEKEDEFRNLCNFMSRSPWDNEGMLEEYQIEILRFFDDPNSMITGVSCSFPKKGQMSVGVARQSCGPLGKVNNCQNSVMTGIVSPDGYGLLDYELYMPKKWFGDDFEEKREKCRVPEDLEFKKENEILSEMINKMVISKLFKGKYVGVDAAFGSDQVFLDSLPQGLIYFADIRSDVRVFVGRPEMAVPESPGKDPKPKLLSPSFGPRLAREIAEDESFPWENVVLGAGPKGPIIAKDKCLKVAEWRGETPGKDVWLYIRQLADGHIKYSLCNESMDATIDAIRKLASMRWSIEQCFEECKKSLGMDHYEVRSWMGWRRHILLTFIAHLFVNKLRRMVSLNLDSPAEPEPIIEDSVKDNEYLAGAINFKNNHDTGRAKTLPMS